MVDAEVVDESEPEDAMQVFTGANFHTLAPGPQPQHWGGGVPRGGNQWQGVGNISDQGNLPNVVVSNNTGQTTYTDASTLLAK